MLKFKWTIIASIFCTILSLIIGKSINDNILRIDDDVIGKNTLNFYGELDMILNEFSINKDYYKSFNSESHLILEVQLLNKYAISDCIIAEVEVLKIYKNTYNIEIGNKIKIFENYQVFLDNNNIPYETSINYNIILYKEGKYIVNLKESDVTSDLYDYAFNNFSCYKIDAEQIELKTENEISLVPSQKKKNIIFIPINNTSFYDDIIIDFVKTQKGIYDYYLSFIRK